MGGDIGLGCGGRRDKDVQEAAGGDRAEAWGTGDCIPDSQHFFSGSAHRPPASPLGATRSGAKGAGRSCLSVSLQPAWSLQSHFPAIARDAVCWLPRGPQGHLPGERRPLHLPEGPGRALTSRKQYD